MRTIEKKQKKTIVRNIPVLIRFVLVGAANTGIDYLVFILLSVLGLPPLPAHVISYTAGLVNSFFWNRFWTFRVSGSITPREGVRFVLVNLTALAAAGGILLFGITGLRLSEIAAKAIALPFSLGINFLGNRLWVFPTRIGGAKRKDAVAGR